jgi:hypothetical protein
LFAIAEQVTGLPPQFLRLIGGDQITPSSLLGLPVPARAQPMLRALSPYSTPALEPPPGSARPQTPDQPEADRLDAALVHSHLERILAELVGGRRPVHSGRAPSTHLRTQLDRLQADDLIELDGSVYRAPATWRSTAATSCPRRRHDTDKRMNEHTASR